MTTSPSALLNMQTFPSTPDTTSLRAKSLALALPGHKSPEPCIATVQYLRTEETLAEMSSRVGAAVQETFEVPSTEAAPPADDNWGALQGLAKWLRETIVEREIAQTACAERPFKVTVVGLSSRTTWTGFVEDLETAELVIKNIEDSGTSALEESLSPVLNKPLAAIKISGRLVQRSDRFPHEMDEARFWFSQPVALESFKSVSPSA